MTSRPVVKKGCTLIIGDNIPELLGIYQPLQGYQIKTIIGSEKVGTCFHICGSFFWSQAHFWIPLKTQNTSVSSLLLSTLSKWGHELQLTFGFRMSVTKLLHNNVDLHVNFVLKSYGLNLWSQIVAGYLLLEAQD